MFVKYTLAANDLGEENCIFILSPHQLGSKRFLGRGKDYVVDVFEEGSGQQMATITHFYNNREEGKIPTEKLNPEEGFEPVFIENDQLYDKESATEVGSNYFKLLKSQEGYLVMAVWEEEQWKVDFNCLAYGLSYMEIYKALNCEALVYEGHIII